MPEFPAGCKIVKENSLFLRDILCCYKNNGYNPHIYWGGQYDPHYEHNPPQFKMCHGPQRNGIAKKANEDYDNIYILFRTNKLKINGNKHFITGFYEVNQKNIELSKDYEDYTIYAKNAVFLEEKDAIDITDFLKERNYYITRMNSDTDREGLHKKYLGYIDEMKSKPNKLDQYIEETNRINEVFKSYEYEDGEYPICENCASKNQCCLIKRIKSAKKLYHNLPQGISKIIREHYQNKYLGKTL